jgi:hypothetical protein
MTVDLILVGPWNRLLHEKVLMHKYVNYFLELKNSQQFNRVIYSCTESADAIESKYFDLVLCNPAIDLYAERKIQNQNTNNLIENSRAGIEASNADFVIKVRSDLIISDFSAIINFVFLNQSKLIVDYEIQHTLLIPYYYPDFLVAGRRSEVLALFQKLDHKINDNFVPQSFCFSPTKCLTIGMLSANNCYTEYAIWSNYLYRADEIFSVKPMCQLNFNDLKKSLEYFSRSICFVNRRTIFTQDGKFILPIGASFIFFTKSGILKQGFSLYFLLTYHYILYVKRSLSLISQKLFS